MTCMGISATVPKSRRLAAVPTRRSHIRNLSEARAMESAPEAATKHGGEASNTS